MYGSLDVSTSGMIAQRTRMEVVASNIAHANTLENDQGEYDPYLRRAAMFSPKPGGNGVEVSEIHIDETALRTEYRKGHPFADEEGYLQVPDIDTTFEWVNGLQASRAYEANIVAAETTKNMMAQALRLLA
ncbi:MAG: flagellar basal body rod protein FlgC [Phycisphaerales bacterium]|nr:flagellar basal body rod protein FlgC [Phycisphaerales bacterium]